MYGFIHSLRRNKLTPERAEDLVFVHNNSRLLSRSTAEYTSGPAHMWDVGGDGYDTFDGVSILQAADLSLDEPEFELMITGDEKSSTLSTRVIWMEYYYIGFCYALIFSRMPCILMSCTNVVIVMTRLLKLSDSLCCYMLNLQFDIYLIFYHIW
jgi:hypothetical protein